MASILEAIGSDAAYTVTVLWSGPADFDLSFTCHAAGRHEQNVDYADEIGTGWIAPDDDNRLYRG